MVEVLKEDARPRATRYRQFLQHESFSQRARKTARSLAAVVLSQGLRFPDSANDDWVIFPYYHYVLDDERRAFERQLRYMRRFGQFLSLDDALDALRDPAGINGRFFCLSFDDGLKTCITNALPILLDFNCPAAFYVPTDYVGSDLDADWSRVQRFYEKAKSYVLPMEFLDWDDCRALDAAGMTIGSHTCSHTRLVGLSPAELARELGDSKTRIEQELGKPCKHFACPWGRPGRDFNPAEHVSFIKNAGYESMLTTRRGANRSGTDPFAVLRQEFLANEGPSMLRYMFARWHRFGGREDVLRPAA